MAVEWKQNKKTIYGNKGKAGCLVFHFWIWKKQSRWNNLVTGKEDIDTAKKEIVEKYNLKKIKNVVAGGSERYESVYNGLKEVTGNIVLIHDGARPLINNEIIERSIEGTIKSDACVVGVPVKDTIKRADKEGYIIDTPNRSELWITQTPQSFKTDLVKMAYKKMKEELEKGNTTLNITDDAMVVEEFTTNQVRFVQGDYKNIKVTTPEDIDIAELFIELDAK